MSKDDLEDRGLYEVCTNCGSINLHQYETDSGEPRVVCTNCGTIDFTHTVTEEEYESNQRRKNE